MTKVNGAPVPFDWNSIKSTNNSPILKGLLLNNLEQSKPLPSLYDLISFNPVNSKAPVKNAQSQLSFIDKSTSNYTNIKLSPTTSASSLTDKSGLNSGAQALFNAMKKYGSVAKGEDRITIAKELDAACKFFKVDPKLMLAVFAHESAGINPKAKSHTGAKGLGQLTGVAIKE
ncbi:MAG: transglycosylase SLT domain-containing protein, partial [Candidatus Sericytochromatia bacterium]